MASEQCRKPSDQTSHQIHSGGHHQKTSTTQTHYNQNHSGGHNEQSLSEKVKEMANSARKMFHHNEQQGHPATTNHTHKPTTYGTAHDRKKKKTTTTTTEGHEHHCMPKMLKKKKKKKKGKAGNGSSSDSD